MNQSLVTNRIVEVTASPEYPKLSAVELLTGIPTVTDEIIFLDPSCPLYIVFLFFVLLSFVFLTESV
jgi:hypothetical protein